MTISPPGVRLGAQQPRVSSVPDYASSAGEEAIEFCESFGLHLDPWQQFVLTRALGERRDHQWAAFEVGLIVPRQNGKGALLEARELAGLFLFGENLILHSSHEFKTAAEGFLRVKSHIDNCDHLRKRVKQVRTSHGDEGIELMSGARLRFVARSTGSGRGFTGDVVILDEAYNLGAKAMSALLPTLSARPNPQVWYTSSAGMESSEQLRNVRDRGTAGSSPRLAYFEWSMPVDGDPDDRGSWAQANPALGIRISEEFVESERAAMDAASFARERLGVWAERGSYAVIPRVVWQSRGGAQDRPDGPVALAVEAAWPDAEFTSVGVAGRCDGELLVQVTDHHPGTSWVVSRVVELAERHHPCAVVIDVGGPAGFLVDELRTELEPLGVLVVTPSVREIAGAATRFLVEVAGDEPTVRHYDQPELDTAVAAAEKRPLGDAWTWARKGLTDISPLVAVTLALHGFLTYDTPVDLAANIW